MTQIEKFGKYILLEKIASGGMAEIYLARAPGASGISKYVAIKRILPQYSDNPEFVEMFKSEAKIAINLKHSNIVSIFEFGVEKGQFFLVMDFVEGKNLRQIINRFKHINKTLSLDQILFIIREAAAGLDSAHRCLDGESGRPLNITHRDISPQNIMISYEGEVKIVDFGIAKTETQIEATRAGTLKGKFGYMSPEQAEGIQVDLRTDIFSLGIVLWELIANDRLFLANNEMNTLRKIRDCQIPSLRKINPKIPEDLEKIVNKALAKDRNSRYQTAAAFHRDLNTYLNKNFPSFSQHDFGNIIKSTFSDEIITIRNKLVEYSKIDVPDHSDQALSLDITRTITATETPVASEVSTPSPSKMIDFPSTSTHFNQRQEVAANEAPNFKELVESSIEQLTRRKQEKSRLIAKESVASPAIEPMKIDPPRRTGPEPWRTLNETKSLPKKKSNSFNHFNLNLNFLISGSTLLLVTLWVGIYFGRDNLKNPFAVPTTNTCSTSDSSTKCNSTNTSSTQPPEPSVLTYKVSVTSSPPGAAIYVNDKDLGKITPAIIELEAKKTHAITLKLPGYLVYHTDYTADKQGDLLRASLQKTVQGYLNIRVFPNNARLYINSEEIHETLPLNRYAVPANKKLVIRAVDKWTGAEAKESVTVEENRIKTVELYLNQK